MPVAEPSPDSNFTSMLAPSDFVSATDHPGDGDTDSMSIDVSVYFTSTVPP